MIRLLIRKELKEFFRASWVLVLAVGMLLMLALALYNGFTHYQSQHMLTTQAQQLTYEQFLNQGDKDPHSGAHFGFYAFKPIEPLSFLDSGLEDFTGTSFYLEPHKRGEVKFKKAADATGIRRFGFLNVGYFLQYLFPLFVFLLSYNLFAKEWENGTIRMIRSTRLTTAQLLTGKLLACLAGVYGLLLVLFMACVGVTVAAQGWSVPLLKLLGAYGLVFAAYGLILTLIGGAVSLLTRHSSVALLILASFYLWGVFFVPRFSGEISRYRHPSKTSVSFDRDTEQFKFYGLPGQASRDARREELLQQTLHQYKVTRVEDLPVNFIPIAIEYFEESDGVIMDQAYGELDQTFARQNRLVQLVSVLSPFEAFRELSMALTATDLATHQDFSLKAETHRMMIQHTVDQFYEGNRKANRQFWSSIPSFSYTSFSLQDRLTHALTPLLTLGGWLLGCVALLALAYRNLTLA